MPRVLLEAGCNRASWVSPIRYRWGTREFTSRVPPEQFQVTLCLTDEAQGSAAATVEGALVLCEGAEWVVVQQ